MTQQTEPSYAHAHGYDPYAGIPSGDVGWFGATLYKKAKKAVKKVAKVAGGIPGVSTMTAPLKLANDIAHGKNVVRSAARAVTSTVKDVRRGLPIAASAASFVPGIGQGVGAGLSALNAVSQGKSLTDIAKSAAMGALPGGAVANAAINAMQTAIKGGNVLEMAESAARGAIPDEIEAAIDVASDVARGRNVIKSVLKNGVKAFHSGSDEAFAFNAAGRILTTGGDLKALAGARRLLTSEGARRAFDTAVGTAAKVARSEQAARRLVSSPPKFVRTVQRLTKPKVQFQPLNARSAAMVANLARGATTAALYGRRETAGLEDNASIYVVENGDSPWAIAKKLMGDGNRWRELVKANPKKATVKSGANAGSFTTLFAGERLNLPASWTAKHATTLTADAMAQARALLSVWSGSDGKNEAGVVDYGSKPEDQLPTWGSRDRFMLVSFVNWWNRTKATSLPVSGDLVDRAADALRQWAAEHAASANAPPTPVTPTPSDPEPTPTPAVVPVVTPPVITPAVVSPPSVVAPTQPTQLEPGLVGGDPWSIGPLPADIQALYDSAKRLTDPNQIRTVAGSLRSRSRDEVAQNRTAYAKRLEMLASDLEVYADKLEAKQMGVPDPNPSAVTTVPLTVTGQAPAPSTGPAPAAKGDDGMGLIIVGGVALAKLAGIL